MHSLICFVYHLASFRRTFFYRKSSCIRVKLQPESNCAIILNFFFNVQWDLFFYRCHFQLIRFLVKTCTSFHLGAKCADHVKCGRDMSHAGNLHKCVTDTELVSWCFLTECGTVLDWAVLINAFCIHISTCFMASL